jgi:hypothetical protein
VTVVLEFKLVYSTRAVGWPAGGPDGISIAPALDTADAVIIVALPLLRGSPAGPKSLKRTRA